MNSDVIRNGVETVFSQISKSLTQRRKVRDELEKSVFNFPVPIRCCWLFPKIKTNLAKWEDPYTVAKEDLRRGRKFPFPSNVLSKRWDALTDFAERKSDRQSAQLGRVDRVVGPLKPQEKIWNSAERIRAPHPDSCTLIAGGFIYSDRRRLLPSLEDDAESEWHTELGRVRVHASPMTGGGDSERLSVEKHFDFIRLTKEKARRSNLYVMFKHESEQALLYVEDPELNVASFYVVNYVNADGESCASQILEITQHRPFNSGIQCFLLDVENASFSPSDVESVLTLSFVMTTVGLSATSLYAVQRRPHLEAVKSLAKELFCLSSVVDDPDRRYSRRDEIECFFDHVYDFHAARPPGDFAERVRFETVEVQLAGLNPVLRPYQVLAVKWMLEKEGALATAEDGCRELDLLFDPVKTLDGKTIFYNRHVGTFVSQRPTCPSWPKGGILADEMGLGKTVEILALILCHLRPGIEEETPLPVVAASLTKTDSGKTGVVKRRRGGSDESSMKKPRITEIADDLKNDKRSKTKAFMKTKKNNGDAKQANTIEDKEIVSNEILRNLESEDGIAFSQYRSDLRPLDNLTNLSNGIVPRIVFEQQEANEKSQENSTEKRLSPLSICEEDTLDAIEWLSGVRRIGDEVTSSTSDLPHLLECSCGLSQFDADPLGRHRVQCNTCGMLQHAECVGYDLRNPHRGAYHCPHCWSSRACPPCPSSATLIVSPATICHQWMDEIKKHINEKAGLKVLMYAGVQVEGFMYPRAMAEYDLVITTYEAFQKEVDFLDLPSFRSSEGRKLRNPKRYIQRPTPLTGINWWRICLDEAQMVESVSTKTAQMALRLDAVNRWCVTGTPINKGLDDLYGLILFLGLEPFCTQQWWERCLLDPYRVGERKPMFDVVARVLWRSAKKHVEAEVNLPPVENISDWLRFSPVEEHFYRYQTRLAISDAKQPQQLRLRSYDNQLLSSIDRYTLNALLQPLLRLRQACCHPQAVRGELLSLAKSTMTMEQVLETMTHKAKKEAEEAHRILVSSMNGLAGIHILQKNIPAAVAEYRAVIRSVETHADRLHTDSMQQLHAFHNLHWLLTNFGQSESVSAENLPAGVAPTLRDSSLAKNAEEIRAKYSAKAMAAVEAARESYRQSAEAVQKLSTSGGDAPLYRSTKKGRCDAGSWWLDLLERFEDRGEDAVVSKVHEELDQVLGTSLHSFYFKDIRGLRLELHNKLLQLQEAHDQLVEGVTRLDRDSPPSPRLKESAVFCHFRPVGRRKNDCDFCVVDRLFESYESRLFAMTKTDTQELVSTEDEDDTLPMRLQGSWADSAVERTLKTLHTIAKSQVSEEVVRRGALHLKLIAAWKREFRSLRALWIALGEHVAALDELEMAMERFRLRLPGELESINVLDAGQLCFQRLRLENDKNVADRDLKKKTGTLLYLNNLGWSNSLIEEAGNDSDGGGGKQLVNPEPCSICLTSLGGEWSVLSCGHCFCLTCTQTLVERRSDGNFATFGRTSTEPILKNRKIRCALCREITAYAEIGYVTTRRRRVEAEAVKVRGSHSTKVEAVVRKIVCIQLDDPEARILVFSSWQEVLGLVANALSENDIRYVNLCRSKGGGDRSALRGPHSKTTVLSHFKSKNAVARVLLLPISSGANGLNLVEANHVIFVEPVLNLAAEFQAVGRIHRIGQTKKTFVHRLCVTGTVEERINALLRDFREKRVGNEGPSTSTATLAAINDDSNETGGMTLADLDQLIFDGEEGKSDDVAESTDDDF